jgi:hypothetical protein
LISCLYRDSKIFKFTFSPGNTTIFNGNIGNNFICYFMISVAAVLSAANSWHQIKQRIPQCYTLADLSKE